MAKKLTQGREDGGSQAREQPAEPPQTRCRESDRGQMRVQGQESLQRLLKFVCRWKRESGWDKET